MTYWYGGRCDALEEIWTYRREFIGGGGSYEEEVHMAAALHWLGKRIRLAKRNSDGTTPLRWSWTKSTFLVKNIPMPWLWLWSSISSARIQFPFCRQAARMIY